MVRKMHKHTETGGRLSRKRLSLSGKSNRGSSPQIPDVLKKHQIHVETSLFVATPTLREFQYDQETTATYLRHKIPLSPKEIARDAIEHFLIVNSLKRKYLGSGNGISGLVVEYQGSMDEMVAGAEEVYFTKLRAELDLVGNYLSDRARLEFFCAACANYLQLSDRIDHSKEDLLKKILGSWKSRQSGRKLPELFEVVEAIAPINSSISQESGGPAYLLEVECLKKDALGFYQSVCNSLKYHLIAAERPGYAKISLETWNRFRFEVLNKLREQRDILTRHLGDDDSIANAWAKVESDFVRLESAIKTEEKTRREEGERIFAEKARSFAEFSDNEHLKECLEQGYSCRELYYKYRFAFLKNHIELNVIRPLCANLDTACSVSVEFETEKDASLRDALCCVSKSPSLFALKLRKSILKMLEDSQLAHELHIDDLESIKKRYERFGVHQVSFSCFGEIMVDDATMLSDSAIVGSEPSEKVISEYLNFGNLFKVPTVPEHAILVLVARHTDNQVNATREG